MSATPQGATPTEIPEKFKGAPAFEIEIRHYYETGLFLGDYSHGRFKEGSALATTREEAESIIAEAHKTGAFDYYECHRRYTSEKLTSVRKTIRFLDKDPALNAQGVVYRYDPHRSMFVSRGRDKYGYLYYYYFVVKEHESAETAFYAPPAPPEPKTTYVYCDHIAYRITRTGNDMIIQTSIYAQWDPAAKWDTRGGGPISTFAAANIIRALLDRLDSATKPRALAVGPAPESGSDVS